MAPQREERHAVDWLKNDSRGTEVRQARRNTHADVGGLSAESIDCRVEPPAALPAMITDWTLCSAADLRDVVNRSEDRKAVHNCETGLRDLNESAHAIAHPWAALQCARERPSLVVGTCDQGHLTCDGVGVEGMCDRRRVTSRPADDRHQAEAEEQDDEVTRDVDARQET